MYYFVRYANQADWKNNSKQKLLLLITYKKNVHYY